MKKIAIITARGGSQRIPRKNLKTFIDRPIIAYSIVAAIESQLFDEVMVSTDDQEIKDVALKFGAKVPFMRSEKNSDHFATTRDVITEVMENYGDDFTVFCCIYPTAPFVTAFKLMDSYKLFSENDADFCIPIVKYSYPIQRAVVVSNGQIKFEREQYVNTRSQDLPETFHDAGQFYWGKRSSLNNFSSFFSGKVVGYLVSELESQDIDNVTDWKLAELKYGLLKNEDFV